MHIRSIPIFPSSFFREFFCNIDEDKYLEKKLKINRNYQGKRNHHSFVFHWTEEEKKEKLIEML